jgi:hypothetical protein
MNLYKLRHKYYCGVDLHSRTLYLCVVGQEGGVLLHRSLPCDPTRFLLAVARFREDLVVAVECVYSWYWLADLCAKEGIAFVVGHALYMRIIHGAKAKSDRIDSEKVAVLLRGGLTPNAYAYPADTRATRDLMRGRLLFVRQRGSLLAHIQITHHQYNVDPPARRITYRSDGKASARLSRIPASENIASDLTVADHLEVVIGELGGGGDKIGNAYLKWAFSEAAVLFVAKSEQGCLPCYVRHRLTTAAVISSLVGGFSSRPTVWRTSWMTMASASSGSDAASAPRVEQVRTIRLPGAVKA